MAFLKTAQESVHAEEIGIDGHSMLTGSLKAAQMDASCVGGLEEGEIVVERDAERKGKE